MPKEYNRVDRIGAVMQKELALLIQYEIKDPRVNFVTVCAVKVSRDLSHAKVYISQLGDQQEIAQTVAVLNKAKGFLRTQLAHKMNLRITPELNFIYDKSVAEGGRLSALIDEAIEKSEAIKKKTDE